MRSHVSTCTSGSITWFTLYTVAIVHFSSFSHRQLLPYSRTSKCIYWQGRQNSTTHLLHSDTNSFPWTCFGLREKRFLHQLLVYKLFRGNKPQQLVLVTSRLLLGLLDGDYVKPNPNQKPKHVPTSDTNISLAFVLPLCLTIIFNQHDETTVSMFLLNVKFTALFFTSITAVVS